MNNVKFPKKLGIIVGGIIGIFILALGFTQIQGIAGRASDEAPRDVAVTDVSSSTAKINWTTGVQTQGVVEYGTSPTSLNSFAPEGDAATSHQVELTLLTGSTTYYFQISIGGKKYDNGGVPWTFSTKGLNDETGSSSSGLSGTSPTPISKVRIPNPQESSCDEKDCDQIKAKLGEGCTTEDYFKCVRSNPTQAPLTTP
ncbi:fibronectin type III domain-containing protein [Candidatus Roizmanbacteria bacterium]|nr:fibronectin type III domain-containing protein [Candidatus Roizmanbacteria bacterium]